LYKKIQKNYVSILQKTVQKNQKFHQIGLSCYEKTPMQTFFSHLSRVVNTARTNRNQLDRAASLPLSTIEIDPKSCCHEKNLSISSTLRVCVLQGRLLPVFWLAVCFYSAWSIFGFYHPDEYGQMNNFYLYKLNLLDAAQVPWEFHEKMRSWLQPALYYSLIGSYVKHFGYDHVIVERTIYLFNCGLVVVGFFIVLRLLQKLRDNPQEKKPLHAATLYATTLWFVPSYSIRHSSEALSALLVVSFIYFWHRADTAVRQRLSFFVAGIFAGFAFWVRFQTGFFIAGMCLSSLAVLWRQNSDKKRIIKSIVSLLLGVVISSIVALLIDRWGYGVWVFSPWNYFVQNILRDQASQFGKESWHFYFSQSTLFLIQPFLWPILVWSAWRTRFDKIALSLSCGILLFLFIHILIPHKEMRFLFPILVPCIILVTRALYLFRLPEAIAKHSWAMHILWKPWFVLNLLVLTGFTLFGCKRSRV